MMSRARSGWLFVVLLLLFDAMVASALYAASSFQDFDQTVTEIETNIAMKPLVRRAARERREAGRPAVHRRALVADPVTQDELREMIAFCDTASVADRDALREVALQSANALAAARAVRALGRLRILSEDPQILALLADPRERVRHETIVALGDSGDVDVVPLIEPLVTSEDAKVRVLAIHALGRIGGERAQAVLHRIVESSTASREDVAFARAALANANR